MSRRSYSLGRRQVSVDQTRGHILATARELLLDAPDPRTFGINAVARQAHVARMTVYNQFGSRAGLLEAVFDDLAARGGLDRLPEVFTQPPATALQAFIDAFCAFWAADRLVHRRVYGFAVLDPELEAALASRNARRREGLQVLLKRRHGHADPDVLDVLHVLTSFATFDALATAARTTEQTTQLIQRLANAALGA